MINDWNKLLNDCVNASSVNMFKYTIDRYLMRASYGLYRRNDCWTLDKLMASLSTCHLELVVLDGSLVLKNQGRLCLKDCKPNTINMRLKCK